MKAEDFLTLLFEIEVNTHIMHLQTTSYSQHKALQKVYEDIVDFRDRFAEAYQGEFGIIKGYKNINVVEGLDPVKYLESCCVQIEEFRGTLTEPYLQAIVEDVQEFLYGKKYLLKFLK